MFAGGTLARGNLPYRPLCGFTSLPFLRPDEESIECQRPRSSQNQGNKCRKVQKVCLVSQLSEVSAGSCHRLKFDRAEPIGKVNKEQEILQSLPYSTLWREGKQIALRKAPYAV